MMAQIIVSSFSLSLLCVHTKLMEEKKKLGVQKGEKGSICKTPLIITHEKHCIFHYFNLFYAVAFNYKKKWPNNC